MACYVFLSKDFTAGCTLEAKGFSELKDFSKYNAEIVGISADNQDSHESFCSEIHKLHFII